MRLERLGPLVSLLAIGIRSTTPANATPTFGSMRWYVGSADWCFCQFYCCRTREEQTPWSTSANQFAAFQSQARSRVVNQYLSPACQRSIRAANWLSVTFRLR